MASATLLAVQPLGAWVRMQLLWSSLHLKNTDGFKKWFFFPVWGEKWIPQKSISNYNSVLIQVIFHCKNHTTQEVGRAI